MTNTSQGISSSASIAPRLHIELPAQLPELSAALAEEKQRKREDYTCWHYTRSLVIYRTVQRESPGVKGGGGTKEESQTGRLCKGCIVYAKLGAQHNLRCHVVLGAGL